MISRMQMVFLAVMVVADVVLGAVSTRSLPDQVPVHWNFQGEVDRYGSPWELAFLLPGFVVMSAGLLVLLPKMGDMGAQLERSRTTYGRMAIAIVGSLIAIHVLVTVRGSHPFEVVSAIVAATGVLIAALGNWTSKLRRNVIAGFRTPWTLKSDAVWERTNRVGGRLMCALGIAVALAALCFPVWAALTILLGGLLTVCVWAYYYSWSLASQAP